MKALGIWLAVAMFAILTQAVFADEADQTGSWARPFLEYEASKIDPWGAFVLNLLIPLGGIGSFVQGDTTGGLLVTGGQVLGLVVAGADSGAGYATTTVYVGLAVYSAATLVGLAIPFTYANATNEKLRRDLGISVSDVSLSEQGLAVTFAADL